MPRANRKIKLLFITQKVDEKDPVLGFTIEWIRALARHASKVVVICLAKGRYDLPKNVEVYSLGKELGLRKTALVKNFLANIVQLRDKYDKVLVHMTPIWVVVGAPVFKLLKKDVYLWYTHKAVTFDLVLAEKIVKKIFSAAKESINIKSSKIRILGQGIPTRHFLVPPAKRKAFTLVQVGRITPIKDQLTLVRALHLLKKKGFKITANIVGGPVMPGDEQYMKRVLKEAESKSVRKNIILPGFVPYEKIAGVYGKSLINVNLCPTGGVDKAVLEGTLAGALPLVCNRAFLPLLGKYKDVLTFKEKDPDSLASKIIKLLDCSARQRETMVKYLRNRVIEKYDLDKFAKRLVDELA